MDYGGCQTGKRGDEKWLNLILRKMDIHCQSMENT